MVAGTLALSALLQLLTAASFLRVGATLRRRAVSGEKRRAALAFVAWWWGVAAYLVVQGFLTMLAAAGVAPLPLYVAAHVASAPLLAASVWGIAFYVLYLFTGWERLALPLGAFYAACGVAYVALLPWYGVRAPLVSAWLVGLEYARPLDARYSLVLAAFALPPILGSLAYLSLVPRLATRAQKYRATLVSLGILAWLGSGLVVRLGSNDLAKAVNLTIVGLLTALTVLAAYHPPRRVARWLAEPEEGAAHARESAGA